MSSTDTSSESKRPAGTEASDAVRDPVRLAALRDTGMLDSDAEEVFDRLTRLAVKLVGAPAAFLSLVDEARDFYKSSCGFPEPLASRREMEGVTFCHYAIESDGPLVISDARGDPRYRDVPTVESLGVTAYVGVPVRIGGEAVGSFCAIDFVPREWTATEVETMEVLAESAQREIELRLRARQAEALAEQLGETAVELEQQIEHARRSNEELAATNEELRRNEERHELVALATNDAVWDWNLATGALDWSPAVHTLFGYGPDEVAPGIEWWYEHIHPDDAERVVRGIHEAVDGGAESWSDEYRFLRANGSFAEVLDRGYVRRDSAGRGVRMIGAIQDVSQRRRAEGSLRDREGLIRSLLDATSEGIYGVDVAGRCTFVNRAAASILGYTPEEVLGADVHALIHHTRADGSPYPAAECPLLGAVREGRAIRLGDERLWRSDGTWFPAQYAADPIYRDGVLTGAVVTLSDNTERNRAEEVQGALYHDAQRARAEAERANRAKSQFLANMSHEIRTPINAVMGYADLLDVGVAGALTDPQRDYLDKIRSSSRHLLGLVNDILDLSKVEAGEMRVRSDRLPLRGIAGAAVELVAPQAEGKGLSLVEEANCDPDAEFVGDEDRARQIVVNLLSNAVKFTPAEGRVTVRCRVDARPGADAEVRGAGPWVAIEVEDTGIGIPADQTGNVFEPFVQVEGGHTRKVGGTGLGLTISRRLARMMGGDLTLRSEPGRGSCFTLWLPAAGVGADVVDEAPAATGWPARAGEVPGLAELGHLLADQADELVRELGNRLERDPVVPGARGLDRAQLEDHIATLLMDVGKALITIDEGCGEPLLMQDSENIQFTIAKLHGEQRRRLGWTGAEMRREFEVQKELVDALIAREGPGKSGVDVRVAIGIVHRLLDRAEAVSMRALGGEPTGDGRA
jgi:PAS domain S-box-containing protein